MLAWTNGSGLVGVRFSTVSFYKTNCSIYLYSLYIANTSPNSSYIVMQSEHQCHGLWTFQHHGSNLLSLCGTQHQASLCYSNTRQIETYKCKYSQSPPPCFQGFPLLVPMRRKMFSQHGYLKLSNANKFGKGSEGVITCFQIVPQNERSCSHPITRQGKQIQSPVINLQVLSQNPVSHGDKCCFSSFLQTHKTTLLFQYKHTHNCIQQEIALHMFCRQRICCRCGWMVICPSITHFPHFNFSTQAIVSIAASVGLLSGQGDFEVEIIQGGYKQQKKHTFSLISDA